MLWNCWWGNRCSLARYWRRHQCSRYVARHTCSSPKNSSIRGLILSVSASVQKGESSFTIYLEKMFPLFIVCLNRIFILGNETLDEIVSETKFSRQRYPITVVLSWKRNFNGLAHSWLLLLIKWTGMDTSRGCPSEEKHPGNDPRFLPLEKSPLLE